MMEVLLRLFRKLLTCAAVIGALESPYGASAASWPSPTLQDVTLNGSVKGGSTLGTDVGAGVYTAAGGSSPRTLADRGSAVISLKDFGAVCDGTTDDYTAEQAAFTYAATKTGNSNNAVRILAPYGTCFSSKGVTYTATDSRSLSISGAGQAVSVLQFASGGLSVSSAGGSIDVSDLHIQRNSAPQGDTGLSVTATATNTSASVSRVRVDGATRAGSFMHGAVFVGVGPNIVGLTTILPDDAVSGDTSTSSGLDISGTTIAGVTQFAIDSKIVNSVFQGGHSGINIHGPVQGVFVTNSEALGGEIGFNWADDGTAGNYPELLLVNNFHSNSHLYGVYTSGVNQVFVSQGLFLHLVANTDAYTSVSLNNGQNATVSGTVTNGNNPTGGSETGVALNNFGVASIYGNQTETVEGPVVSVTGTGHYISIVGNTGVNYPTYTDAKIVGCGAGVLCQGNNLDNTLAGVTADSSGNVTVVGSLGTSSGNLYVNTVAAFLPATYIDSTNGYGFNIGGTLYNAMTTTGSSDITLCPSSTCHLGNTSGEVEVLGKLVQSSSSTPASSSAPCISGESAWDATYEYRCVAPNSWQRWARGAW